MTKCVFCDEPATEKHHVVPRSQGGTDTIDCCGTCGNQVHMLFENKALAVMSLEELANTDEMRRYLKWREKHPGKHKARMSNRVKKWRQYHR